MAHKLKDIAAVVAVRDYSVARRWYSRLSGRDPELELVDRVGEWQVTARGGPHDERRRIAVVPGTCADGPARY